MRQHAAVGVGDARFGGEDPPASHDDLRLRVTLFLVEGVIGRAKFTLVSTVV